MNPLMFLMGGMGSGNCGSLNLNRIWASAAMQAGMANMVGGIFDGGYGNYATQPYVQQAPVQQHVEQKPQITKEQVDLAYNNYNNLVQLCAKAEGYKNNADAKIESLQANKDAADKGVLKVDQELATLNGKLIELRAGQAPAEQIKEVEEQIKAKEKERVEAQKEVERAKVEIDAFALAQKGKEEELAKIVAQKDKAYQEFQAISQQYTQQVAEARQAQEAIENRQEDKAAAGSKWGRSVLNPQNWTNLNFKGEQDDSANIAKCLRKLAGKGGREEALKYALEHNLVTKDKDGNYQTEHPELKEMINLD